MGSHVSKKGLYISTTIYSLLVLILSIWASYFIHPIIYLVPVGIAFIFYRWAFLHDIAFSENKYINGIIVGSIICLLVAFIAFPIIEIIRNYIYINIVNFGAIYKAKGFALRTVGLAILVLAIYNGLFILFYKSQNDSKSVFDSIDRKVFKENEDTIITYLKGKEATSAITAIPKATIFNDEALKFLVDKRIVIKTTDDKYYLRRTALKDLEYKTDLRFDIIFIVCAIVIYGLVFILIGQTNKANGPVDYTVKTQEYSYVKPAGYVATVGKDENSSILFPKHDITGNSGAIYFSIFNITNPTQISEASELESLKNKYSALPEIQDYKSETSTNGDGNYVISNIMTFADHYETADYIYLTNQAGACEKVILIESRYFDTNSPVAADAKSIVNSVDNLLK